MKVTNQGSGIQNHGPQRTPRDADRGEGEGGFRPLWGSCCGAVSHALPSPTLLREQEALVPLSVFPIFDLRSSASSADETLRPLSVSSADCARVSLTMIVLDEKENLPCALESVRGVVDEIVIVDTGSQDRTVEIARIRGAGVPIHLDRRLRRRNSALAHATGDYAFWLDAKSLELPVAGGLGLDWGFGMCGLFGLRRRDSSNGPAKDLRTVSRQRPVRICVSQVRSAKNRESRLTCQIELNEKTSNAGGSFVDGF